MENSMKPKLKDSVYFLKKSVVEGRIKSKIEMGFNSLRMRLKF